MIEKKELDVVTCDFCKNSYQLNLVDIEKYEDNAKKYSGREKYNHICNRCNKDAMDNYYWIKYGISNVPIDNLWIEIQAAIHLNCDKCRPKDLKDCNEFELFNKLVESIVEWNDLNKEFRGIRRT
jgi:Disulfide bond chaperones of the HSP33 family